MDNMSTLFNDNNSSSDEELKINANYANIYDDFRQKEELHKLKAKYGENTTASNEESNDSSSEDEEIIKNPHFDKEFLITLACLKNKDPCIYDQKVKFFSNNEASEDIKAKEKKKKEKEKGVFLRDYERKIILEREGHFSSSEDENNTNGKNKMPTYVEEQKQLKDNIINALKEEDEDDANLLQIKQKTKDENQKEEEAYKEWLKGEQVGLDPKDQEILKPLRDYWTNPNLDSREKFLRDYILNDKYMDKESYDMNLDYNHVVHDSDENLSEDERTIQNQEEFERKYNFRFEEPDEEFIKRYPRTMENSMRKKDTRRAQKRAEIRERKEKEKQQKKEELKQLKALKRKEIEEKIEKLKEITGNNDMHFDNIDFDTDFDPNEHDKKMKELFNDEYYADAEDEKQKPEFPEIDEELEIESTWDNYDPITDQIDATHEESHCEDTNFNMDADYDKNQVLQSELVETKKKRKGRRRNKFAELIAKEKPKFDPKQFPSYESYFDQYYSLDYEDMIGDLACRFKYRKVIPNDYGLNVEEILMADDRELNKWCSLKKALKHKPEHVEKNEVQIYKEKAKNEALKQKILKSLYTEELKEKDENDKLNVEQTETSRKKRKRKKNKSNKSINIDIVSKEQIMDVTKNVVNNFPNNSNDVKQNKYIQEKDVNKDTNLKEKNVLNNDDNAAIPKKRKIDHKKEKNSQIKVDDINIKKHNEEVTPIDKHEVPQNKKRKNSRMNKIKNSKLHNVHPMTSLNVKRLKTYGISAKKMNKLLKHSKEF